MIFPFFDDILPGSVPLNFLYHHDSEWQSLFPVSDTIPSKNAAALALDHSPKYHDPFREPTGRGVFPDQYLACDELPE